VVGLRVRKLVGVLVLEYGGGLVGWLCSEGCDGL